MPNYVDKFMIDQDEIIIKDSDLTIKFNEIKYYVTPEMFGAVGDGQTNDHQALQSAIDSGKPVKGSGNYLNLSPLMIYSDTNIYLKELICSGNDGLIVEGRYNNILIDKISNQSSGGSGAVIRKTLSTDPNKINAHNNIYIRLIDSFLNGINLTTDGQSEGIQYNTIRFDLITCDNGIVLNLADRTWINSNAFIGGRIGPAVNGIKVNSTGTNEVDGNLFHNIGLEVISGRGIDIVNATNNKFDSIRFTESFTGDYMIKFNNCRNNYIEGDITMALSQFSSTASFSAGTANLYKNVIKASLITYTPNGSWLCTKIEEFNGLIVYDEQAHPMFINARDLLDISNYNFGKENTIINVTTNGTYLLPSHIGKIINCFYIKTFWAQGCNISVDGTTIIQASQFTDTAAGAIYRCLNFDNEGWKVEKVV